MNLEIKEKYDDFIKIIDKKEKMDKIVWLEQYNKHDDNTQNLLINLDNVLVNQQNINDEDCPCNISSGYLSTSVLNEKEKKNLNNSNTSTISKNYESDSNNFKSNYIKNNIKNVENNLSLLDDDFEIKISKTEVSNQINIEQSEFKNMFDKFLNKNSEEYKNDDVLIKDNLEQIYNEILIKKKKKNNILNKITNNYDLSTYLENIKSLDEMIKKISIFTEKNIFEESTKGWNFSYNIYIVDFIKLSENLKKIIFPTKSNIKIGFLYRDYLNPKVKKEENFSKFWTGCENSDEYNTIKKINYDTNNKILYYSFKNLSNFSKFKKKIGKTYYKFFKKTIQILNYKDLIIDLIFYVGIKTE
jgi:hypothetical protein